MSDSPVCALQDLGNECEVLWSADTARRVYHGHSQEGAGRL